MKTIFSPRELARAIGVSESSLKRWVDEGRIPVTRTPGGHRRIQLDAAVRFLRDNEISVVQPSALGLKEIGRLAQERDTSDDGELLRELLMAGDAEGARSLVLTSYIKGQSIAAICDGPIRTAMGLIGSLWKDRPDGIYLEHRATDICLETLRALRLGMRGEEAAPMAVGGAPERDPYAIPSLMAACVLGSVGFQTTNLGADTPVDSLLRAAKETRASLVWLSVSAVADVERISDHVSWLAGELEKLDIDLVLGGRELDRLKIEANRPHRVFGSSMDDLAGLGRRILVERS